MINQTQLIEQLTDYAKTFVLDSKKATDMFRKAFVDTITNTITVKDNGNIFVATGDIPAMWLRDSTFQVLPYLNAVSPIPEVADLIHGVINQQIDYIKHDPYANAFNQTATGAHYTKDKSNIEISDLVWERKFEIDSLCAPLFLAYQLYMQAKYTAHLTADFWKTVDLITNIFIKEQHHECSDYYFKRPNCPPSDTLSHEGKGRPIGYTGMVWSGFRPSDDACVYGYFIPGNMFIVVVMKQMLLLLEETVTMEEESALIDTLKPKIKQLIQDIEIGIQRFGIMKNQIGVAIYAYEVDGLGNQLFMDDANVPSLLSLPFLTSVSQDDSLYLQTRATCLSLENPYYYKGKVLKGIGSPHTPPNHVWPIALAMEGLTTDELAVIDEKIKLISETDNQTFQCHEGVHVDNPQIYTREWFSWANMTYCSLVFHKLKLEKAETK